MENEIKLQLHQIVKIKVEELNLTQSWLAKQLSYPKRTVHQSQISDALKGKDSKLLKRIITRIDRYERELKNMSAPKIILDY